MDRTNQLALAVLAFSVALGVLGAVLFDGSLGLNAALFALAAAAAFIGLSASRGGTRSPLDWALLASALAWPLVLAWRDSPWLTGIAIAAEALTLYLAYIRAALGSLARIPVLLPLASIRPALGCVARAPGGLVRDDIDWVDVRGGGHLGRAGAAARGLAISVPAVLVFGTLFAAADARFESLAISLFDVDASTAIRIAVAFCASAWIAAACLRFGVLGAQPETRTLAGAPRSLGAIEVLIVLLVLDALFAIYLWVQFTYFFGGDTLVREAGALTYAGYARRGFFELVWVAALTLLLLLGAQWMVGEDDPRAARALRVLAGAMIAMVAVIELSAAHRMLLYTEAFGLTALRFFTSAFMVWLLALFGWLAATVLRGERDRFVPGALAAGLALCTALVFANPEAIIVRTNVERAVNDRGLDVAYLLTLSADAVPALTAARSRMPVRSRHALDKALRARARTVEPDGWRGFNLSRWRAGDVLAEHYRAPRWMPGNGALQ